MKEWYCADLETNTSEDDCRVWMWGAVQIFNTNNYQWGKDLPSLLNYMFSKKSSIWYFRNLKFDGEYFLSYLLNNGYTHSENRWLKDKEFSTLISDKGAFYNIKIRDKGNTIEIRDSLKIISMSIKDTAKAFGLEETKGEIDYHKYRPIGYEPDENEKSYQKNDVIIDAKSLIYFFSKGLEKMTQGSDALYDFKQNIMLGNKNFEKKFPQIDPKIDEFIRKAYKGGFVWVNPLYKGKDVGEGYVLDVNSLFPSRMKLCKLPYGQPKYFTGKYKPNKMYACYVIHFRCMFHVKHGFIPTIQIKHTLRFQENEYLTSSDGEIVELYLTSIDFELFKKHYDIQCLEFIDGYMFKEKVHPEFAEYVDKWGKIKIKAGKEGNKGLRMVAKLMLNCLYGKFGLSLKVRSKIPYLKDGIVKYTLSEEEEREGVYLPVALFITAHARYFTIMHAQKVREFSMKKYGEDMFLYSDTDSIHTILPFDDLKEIFEIDSNEIGKWDVESHFTKARFIRQKCYMETIEGEDKPTVAGLPKSMHDMVKYENFKPGTTYKRTEEECIESFQGTKKRYKRVKGGVVLVDTHFTIKM